MFVLLGESDEPTYGRSDIGQLRTLSPSRADLSDGDDDPSSGGGLFEELSYVTCAGEDDDSVGPTYSRASCGTTS